MKKVKINAEWFCKKEEIEVGTEMVVVRETEKAYLLRYNELCQPVWCPKSACKSVDVEMLENKLSIVENYLNEIGSFLEIDSRNIDVNEYKCEIEQAYKYIQDGNPDVECIAGIFGF